MSGRATCLRGLVVGQRVHHWKFGHGQVVVTSHLEGKQRARVDFGSHGLIDLDVVAARLVDPAALPAGRPRAAWEDLVDESAPLAALGREPWAAWFGLAVADDDAALRKALVEVSTDLQRYPVGRFAVAESDGPEVEVLLHPACARRERMVLAGVIVLGAAAASRPFIAMPFYNDWNHEHVVTPRRIRVCPDRIEALVEADLQLGTQVLPIAFGLPTFYLGRPFLHPDTRVAVALTALAFECEPSPPGNTFRVRHDRAMIDGLHRAGHDLPVDADGLTLYRMAGMSAWIAQAGRADLVDFRGQVVAAQQIALPPGQRAAWKLLLRAWRADAADWLLDMVFDASVWPATEAPAVGSDVQGRAWLVGECLGPVLQRRTAQGP